mgnify:CR=1 FL=1
MLRIFLNSVTFRKSLFKREYSDLLEETSRSLQLGLGISSSFIPYIPDFTIFGGLGKYSSEFTRNGIELAAVKLYAVSAFNPSNWWFSILSPHFFV